MLMCEGYKMFKGSMKIVPLTPMKEYVVAGTWLYKPDYNCWYCNGNSYPAEVCKILTDDSK